MTKKKRAVDLESLHTIEELREIARDLLDKPAYDYFRSGADAERTLAANEDAFDRWAIWPRVLVDVSRPSLATTVLGAEVATPILIAPTAYHRMAHPDGEAGTARAAAAAGSLMIVSTLGTTKLEDVASASSAPKWFQLYVHQDRGFTRELVERAASAGYRAIVLTVDTPVLGRRLRDVRNAFALPEGLTMANLPPDPTPIAGSALQSYVAARHDASLSWKDLDWLASLSSLPIVLKGVLRRDDAARAIEHGAGGVIVSNHGARQLDGVPATIDALGGVAETIDGRVEVYMDGGVRWGTDVLKALALGARAVFIGRPILWGLTIAGQPGVERVLAILRDELERALVLSGCPDATQIDRSIVARA